MSLPILTGMHYPTELPDLINGCKYKVIQLLEETYLTPHWRPIGRRTGRELHFWLLPFKFL